jgi:hypothetical protein
MGWKDKFPRYTHTKGSWIARTDLDAASFFLDGLSQMRSLGLVTIYLHESGFIWVQRYFTILSCSSNASRFALLTCIFLTRLESTGVAPLSSSATDEACKKKVRNRLRMC